MLKVFLVEDEFVVREGIKNNIDWEAHGYHFCGEASDGELAFSMIQKEKPDIVITDIRMPFMDGLTLSKLIKKEMPWIEIIILTGHAEFEYAKEGIKIGVAEYLSKPINGEDLIKAIDGVAVKIEERLKEREIKEMYEKEMEENVQKERKEFFQHLVSGNKNMTELLELGEKLNLDISAIWYNIVLVKARSVNHESEEFSNSLLEIESKLEQMEDAKHVLVFDRNLEGKALLFKGDTQEELEQYQKTYLANMKELIVPYNHIRYFAGLGTPVNRLRELPASFESASLAFAHQYLMRDSHILDSRVLEQGNYVEKEDFDINNIDPKQIDRSKIREFLKRGDKDETIYFVKSFFQGLGTKALKSNIFRQYIVMDAYFCVVEFVEELQFSRDEIEPLDVATQSQHGEDKAMEYVTHIIEKALELREQTASNRYGDIVDQVMEYIEENYAEEELSLNVLASHVNFSPNHLSSIFSQQTGQTFIKYLTDFRMNKAKELLRCTGKKSSAISMEVGYKDPHYFSYLFKKTQGMTPTQYRGGKSAEGED